MSWPTRHLRPGVYKVPYRKKFIKSVREEFQVVMSGKVYHGCGEEFNIKNREMGRKIILPMILGKNIKWGRGKRGLIFGEENQDIKKLWRGRISSFRKLYTLVPEAVDDGRHGHGLRGVDVPINLQTAAVRVEAK